MIMYALFGRKPPQAFPNRLWATTIWRANAKPVVWLTIQWHGHWRDRLFHLSSHIRRNCVEDQYRKQSRNADTLRSYCFWKRYKSVIGLLCQIHVLDNEGFIFKRLETPYFYYILLKYWCCLYLSWSEWGRYTYTLCSIFNMFVYNK